MHFIASRIVLFVIKNCTVEIEQTDWCIYALEKWLYKILSFLLVIIVGFYLYVPVESILVFLTICFLRTRISGWHAKSPVMCILLTILISCGFGFISKTVMLCCIPTYCALLILNVLLFFLYIPVNNPHLHLTAKELVKSKHLAKTRSGALIIVSLLLLLFKPTQLFSICMQFGCLVSLISTFLMKRGMEK